jgi:hypothetical protein
MIPLTPSQAKVKAQPRSIKLAVVGQPTAAFSIRGVRMVFRPVIEDLPVTLFTEDRA